jgi:acetoin utilization protein AcuB
MKPMPTVQKYMTYFPKTIGFHQPIAKAQDYMKKLHIRHLPVLKGGQLVGVITDRDINLILSFKDINPETITVDEAFTPDPYFTTSSTPLNEVTTEMIKKKYGCTIVVDKGKVVGIFTEIDAYKALSDLLNNKLTNEAQKTQSNF